MDRCMYIYIGLYIHTYSVYVYMYTVYIYIMCVCACVYEYVYVYVWVCTCMSVHICVRVCVCVRVYVHSHTCICIPLSLSLSSLSFSTWRGSALVRHCEIRPRRQSRRFPEPPPPRLPYRRLSWRRQRRGPSEVSCYKARVQIPVQDLVKVIASTNRCVPFEYAWSMLTNMARNLGALRSGGSS